MRRRIRATSATLLAFTLTNLGLSGCAPDRIGADEPGPQPIASPQRAASSEGCEGQSLYWGDMHLHTRNSPDAYEQGNVNLTPDDAYAFARGREVVAHNGDKARLPRPLDFLVISDHSEYLGVIPGLEQQDPLLRDWPNGERWMKAFAAGEKPSIPWYEHWGEADPAFVPPEAFQKSVWASVVATADRNDDPGRFTAFAAYEWSSQAGGNNLHRVVVLDSGGAKTAALTPFSSLDSGDPEDLWRALDRYEQATGGRALAIPHNGNVSNGLMFAPFTYTRRPLTRDYAQRRSRWEPLMEVTQIKGDSETHPVLSPGDEFANFERWDQGNIMLSAPKTPEMLPYEYARSALQEGLKHQGKLGANPFKFGLVGGTDIHTSLSTPAENNFFGKFPTSEPSPQRWEQRMGGLLNENWRLSASGLTGVWAPRNTRTDLFNAMQRREVYATTGSRIMVRFYAGWNFAEGDVARADYARVGCTKGVPMGADLLQAPGGGGAPSFMVVASRDPLEANLDRIQIIKGWVDKAGLGHEKIYDVALSDGRRVDPRTGKAPPVGNTVNVKDASYTNSIGEATLSAVWRDPNFDPALRAVYYARVLEIPKPRWTAYDAKRYKLNLPERVTMVVQDRAYTSPIWYQPH